MYRSRNHHTKQPTHRLASLAFLVVLAITIGSAALRPQPAQAQWTTFDIPQMIGNIWDKIKDAATWAYEHGAALAFRNAAKTFTQQLAYNAAVQLSSGGEGQLPLYEVRSFGDVLRDAGDNALGSGIEQLGKGFTGFNVCDPSGINAPSFKLIIGTALFQEKKPLRPSQGCKLSNIRANWEKTLNDPRERDKLLSNFGVAFDPKQHNLGTALKIQENILRKESDAKETAKNEQLQTQGYLPITEPITNWIRTPAPKLKASDDLTTSQILAEPLVFTGDILADALGVFTNTFAARMMKRLQEGVVKQPSKLRSGKFGGNFGPAGGVEYAIQINSSISTPEFKQEAVDIISEFSNCPQNPALAPPNACTIDAKFAQVLRLAHAGTPLTVQEAVDRGLIGGNWVFRRERPRSERVPTAWYLSDLKKLRRARIIPVGWELAAEIVTGSDKTLQQVMGTKSQNYNDGFNGTGPDGKCGALDSDPTSSDDTAVLNDDTPQTRLATSLCGLIDPNWVLKAPPAQCRMPAYGQQLEFEGGQRQQSCVDLQHCVAENSDGSCQAWGYCTKEKNIWRFTGESCEYPDGSGYSPYATCQTFTSAEGIQESYLTNSLVNYDDGACAGAAGCRSYSSAFTPTSTCQGGGVGANTGTICTATTTCTLGGTCTPQDNLRYSEADAARLYLKEAERYTCDAQTEGCHQFLRLAQASTANLPGTCAVNPSVICTNDSNCSSGACIKPGANPIEQVTNYVSATAGASYQTYAKVATVNLREAPPYLNCYDADATNDAAECKNYLQFCRVQEVGCELYTPTDGSPGIPAVASVTDTCPAECSGFNTYEQSGSFFEPTPKLSCVGGSNTGNSCTTDADCTGGTCSSPNANFIPATAQKCSAAQVGCEEFTNIAAGERKEYYAELRQCVQPTDNLHHTYYTWVGSDLTGYQLKSWQLKAEDVNQPASPPIVTSANPSPEFVDAQDCRPDAATFPTSDPDCKQFYDSTGVVHYRFATKTVTASGSCTRYRATNVLEADCLATSGTWEPSTGTLACFYRAIPQEGKRCSAAAASCREYRGPTSDNVKLVFPVSTFGDREPGVNADATPLSGWGVTGLGWSEGTNSTESTSAFGHSFASGADRRVGKDVSGQIFPSKQYILTFWAKHQNAGANNVFAQLFANTPPTQTLSFGSVQPINQEWQVFTFGPVEIPSDVGVFRTSGQIVLIVGASGGNFYLDNVAFREVQDTFFVRKNTWVTPLSCQVPDDLRCATYTDRSRKRYTLTGFSQLCRAEAVGCEALVDTRNSDSPRSTTFPTDNQPALSSLDLDKADQVLYRVYDAKKACSAATQACYRLGLPVLKVSGEVQQWTDTFQRLDPDTFTQSGGAMNPLSPLCARAQDRCAEFKDASNVSHFFRNPGTQVCEYKQVDNLRGYDWYKKGTSELCNLVANSSFENFTTDVDFSSQHAFTGWKKNGIHPNPYVNVEPDPNIRSELYAVPSLKGQYWGASALKVVSTSRAPDYCSVTTTQQCVTNSDCPGAEICILVDPVQVSGVYSDHIDVSPVSASPRYFTISARIFVPDKVEVRPNEFSRWWLEFQAVPADANDDPDCRARGGGPGPADCHHFTPEPVSDNWVNVADHGKWVYKHLIAKVDANVKYISVGVMTNPGLWPAVGNPNCSSGCGPAGQVAYVDDIRIVEAALPFSNLCPADQASCTAFRDPALTKQTYYYLDSSKLDTTSCSGRVSEKDGCLLFNKLSNPQLGWSANATYEASRAQNNKAVSPKPGTPPLTLNDSNLILKVRRDRVCDEWLSCQSESVRFSGNQARSICYALGRCDQWGASGVGKCGNWLDPETNPQPLNVATYRARAASGNDAARLDWADPEYAGYSIPNYYPIDTLTQKNYSSDADRPDIRLTYLRTGAGDLRCNGIPSEPAICSSYGAACTLSPQSGGGTGACTYMDFGVTGTGPGEPGRWNATAPKLCRAYPEADSPFPELSTVSDWQPSCPPSVTCEDSTNTIEVAKTKVPGFKDAYTCQNGEECECTYQRASYTQGETLFYGFNNTPAPKFSVDDDGLATGGTDIYTKLKKRDYLIGLHGYCLEKDPSRLVNVGSSNEKDNACLTWMPLDVVGGEISIYDYAPEAGFQSVGETYYCSQGTGDILAPNNPRNGLLDRCSYAHDVLRGFDPTAIFGYDPSLTKDQITDIVITGNVWCGDGCGCGSPEWNPNLHLTPTNGWCQTAGFASSCETLSNSVLGSGNVDCPFADVDGVKARAVFDAAGRFTGLNFGWCDGSGGSGGFNGSSIRFVLRDMCSEASKVATSLGDKAWTDRVLRRTDFQVQPSDQLGFTSARQVTPYGRFGNSVAPKNIDLPSGSLLVVSDKPSFVLPPITAPATTISTPYSCKGNPPLGNCGVPGVCIAGTKGPSGSRRSAISDTCNSSADCEDNDNRGTGVCTGYINRMCNNGPTPGKACSNNGDCGIGGTCVDQSITSTPTDAFVGISRVQKLFAAVYDVYQFTPAISMYTKLPAASIPFSLDISRGGVTPTINSLGQKRCSLTGVACNGTGAPPFFDCAVNVCQGVPPAFTENRCTITGESCSLLCRINTCQFPGGYGVPYPPLVKQVSFDTNKSPSEAATGFTLISVDGAVTQGDLRLLSPAPVTALFYAYNPNGEQMPLREVLVDWDGNVTPGAGYTSGAQGKYKNRKHICASSKVCSGGTTANRACTADIDCGGSGATCVDNLMYNFGDTTPQACIQDAPNTEGYFSFTKVYLCTGNETACSAGVNTNCFDATALGSEGGACVFTPKVFVKDNWEWCTGSNGLGKWGGTDCATTSDAAWLPSAQPTPKVCNGGANAGKICSTNADCGGSGATCINPSPVRILVKPKT